MKRRSLFKIIQLPLSIIMLILSSPTSAIEDENESESQSLEIPAYSGDDVTEFEKAELEEQEEEFDEEKYNMNIDPDAYKVDDNVFPEEETEF